MRTALRYFGLVLTLAIFILSGLQNISNPAVGASLLAKSNFPDLLRKVGVEYRLRASDYRILVQASGAVFIGFSLFILLNVGRCFFAFLLALCTLIVTIAFHVNIENPTTMSNADLFYLMKNISIIGALFFIAGSGQRITRGSNVNREARTDKKNR